MFLSSGFRFFFFIPPEQQLQLIEIESLFASMFKTTRIIGKVFFAMVSVFYFFLGSSFHFSSFASLISFANSWKKFPGTLSTFMGSKCLNQTSRVEDVLDSFSKMQRGSSFFLLLLSQLTRSRFCSPRAPSSLDPVFVPQELPAHWIPFLFPKSSQLIGSRFFSPSSRRLHPAEGTEKKGRVFNILMTYKTDFRDNEIYPIDASSLDQIILEDRYAKDRDGRPYYPKKWRGDEFLVQHLGLIQRMGELSYPLTKDGKPNYRTVPGKPFLRQVYEKAEGRWIIGRDENDDQCYAKNENGDDYYPEDNTIARKADGSPFYALDHLGTTVFPMDEHGNEFYIGLIDPLREFSVPTHYAISNGGSIYPRQETSDGLECEVLIGGYASRMGGAKFYPMDGNNNEYYADLDAMEEKVLDRYALTNDGKVILPSQYRDYWQKEGMLPKVRDHQVLGLLYRERFKISRDHLTSVEWSGEKKPAPMAYYYRDDVTRNEKLVVPPNALPIPFTRRIVGKCRDGDEWFHFWIVFVVSMIVKLLILCCLQKKSEWMRGLSGEMISRAREPRRGVS